MKPNIRQLKKWIAALDSSDYGPKMRKFYGRPLVMFNWPVTSEWLFRLDDDFIIKTGRSVHALYNVYDYTFPEIATLLELVYVHKMLD